MDDNENTPNLPQARLTHEMPGGNSSVSRPMEAQQGSHEESPCPHDGFTQVAHSEVGDSASTGTLQPPRVTLRMQGEECEVGDSASTGTLQPPRVTLRMQGEECEVGDSASTGTLQPPGMTLRMRGEDTDLVEDRAGSETSELPAGDSGSNRQIRAEHEAFKNTPMTKQQILEAVRQLLKESRMKEAIEVVKRLLAGTIKEDMSAEEDKEIERALYNLDASFNKKWQDTKRTKSRFEKKHGAWYKTLFRLPEVLFSQQDVEMLENVEIPEIQGTPEDVEMPDDPEISENEQGQKRSWENVTERTRRRQVAVLTGKLTGEPVKKVLKAAANVASTSGSEDIAYILRNLGKSPSKVRAAARALRIPKNEVIPYTDREALALLLDMSLTKENYMLLYQESKSRNANLYPPYSRVLEAKKECYPEGGPYVSDREVSVSLQNLLNHTTKRIVQLQDSGLTELLLCVGVDLMDLVLDVSWGFDGSTGHSLYKQAFGDGHTDDDNSLFATTIIPLKLTTKITNEVVWANPHPTSVRYCRPLRLQCVKESKEVILQEEKSVKTEIDELQPILVWLSSGKQVSVTMRMHFTIIDGKVLSIIAGSSSYQVCPICGATPKDFNKIEVMLQRPPTESSLKHGLSPLHAWIRVFEFLLHLGYRNHEGIKKWRVPSQGPMHDLMIKRQRDVQKLLRTEMGLLIDFAKPGGPGSTNDGNTARTALSDKNRRRFSEVIGVEQWLVDGLQTILVVLSSGLDIDSERFQNFCTDLAHRYAAEYNWFYMPATIHKILIHGSQIIRSSSLPIGMLSEQGGESRNKLYKHYRVHHSRKASREKTMQDVFLRSLATSDPIITDYRSVERHRKLQRQPLNEDARRLLKPMEDPSRATARVLFTQQEEEEEDWDATVADLIEVDMGDYALEEESDSSNTEGEHTTNE